MPRAVYGYLSRLVPTMLFTLGMVALLAGCGRGGVYIDWADFVRFDGITYYTSLASQPLPEQYVGAEYATVKFRLDGNVTDSNYHSKDGDAAYLDAGTPVYRVVGYQPTFRLAAKRGNHYYTYEVIANPRARTGADLLDIAGKVTSIGVHDEQDAASRRYSPQDPRGEVGAITDTARVEALVGMALAAPVDTARGTGRESARYFVVFHLSDGTSSIHALFPTANILAPAIQVPAAFTSAIEQAAGE